jgi:hypothetical protein
MVPRSPSNSPPPRQRQEHQQEQQQEQLQGLNTSYEPNQIPKRRIMISKKPLKIEEDHTIPAQVNEKEEGEIEE